MHATEFAVCLAAALLLPATALAQPVPDSGAGAAVIPDEPLMPAAGADVPPAADPAPAAKPTAGYDKGFFLQSEDGRYKLRIGARLQLLFAYSIPEEGQNHAQFSVGRARLLLDGHVFDKSFGYKFEADFGKGIPSLKDFYLDYAIVPQWLSVRAGQWKTPFSRQNITSDFDQPFNDRAITQTAMGVEREIGFAIHDGFEKSPTFEYALGLFNGTGVGTKLSGDVEVDTTTGKGKIKSGKFSNVPARAHPQIAGRIGYNYAPDAKGNAGTFKGYGEHDFEGGPVRFGLATSGIVDLDADGDGKSQLLAQGDYVLKVEGFTTTGGTYLRYVQTGESFGEQTFDTLGFHVQAGYLVLGYVEPAVRYARLVGPGVGGTHHEMTGALSFYFFKTNFQLTTDVAAFVAEDAHTTDWVARAQLQGFF